MLGVDRLRTAAIILHTITNLMAFNAPSYYNSRLLQWIDLEAFSTGA